MNNMKFKIFLIPSVYTIWDGLSLKTISRYCPFKETVACDLLWRALATYTCGAGIYSIGKRWILLWSVQCVKDDTRCRKNGKFCYFSTSSVYECTVKWILSGWKLWKVQKNVSFLSVFSNCGEPSMCMFNSESKQMFLEVLTLPCCTISMSYFLLHVWSFWIINYFWKHMEKWYL